MTTPELKLALLPQVQEILGQERGRTAERLLEFAALELAIGDEGRARTYALVGIGFAVLKVAEAMEVEHGRD